MTSSTAVRAKTRSPSAPTGIRAVAASLTASSGDAGTRLEHRLVLLIVVTRWVTVVAGVLIGLLNLHSENAGHFFPAAIVLLIFSGIASYEQMRSSSLRLVQVLTMIELVLTVGAISVTGAFKSPFILTPITPLLLAGYVWGRRATVGTAVAGGIAAFATIFIQSVDAADQRQAGQIAVVYLLCGALGAFSRNLVVEVEAQRAAAIDQATQMATANELLVSLHRLAQTLPASFDLGEVVESIRRRHELHRR